MKLSVATLLALGAVLAAAVQKYDALDKRVALLEYWQHYKGVDVAPVPDDERRRRMEDAEWYGHTHGPAHEP